MRVITFSRFFPKTHPRAGEPTHFVQKILHSLLPPGYKPATELGYPAKFHTIRKGNRWKVGDQFSARIWTGAPYRSKQEEFAKPIVLQTWEIIFDNTVIKMNGMNFSMVFADPKVQNLASNDGLSLMDFWDWIRPKDGKIFVGQIICWSDKIEY